MLKRILSLLGVLGALGAGVASAQPPRSLNEKDFTQAYVEYLAAKRPDLTLEMVRPLEIKAKTLERDFGTLFLHNVYAIYRQDPSRKDELFTKYAASIFDHALEPPVSLETLVAVVKAKDWVEDMDRVTMGTEGKGFHILSEPISSDLFIVYATDTPNSVTYQDREKILALEPLFAKVKEKGIENLRDVVGAYTFEPVERGVYQLRSAGGDYDSSVPLLPEAFDKFPEKNNNGEVVFAIPSRNILIATRSSNKEGIAFMHELTQKIYSTDPYFVSSSLFAIKNGVWDVYKE